MATQDDKNFELGKEITDYLSGDNVTLDGFKERFEKGNYDVNARSEDRGTPLTWAAANGHKEIVEYLVERGADVNAVNNNSDMNALMYAAWGGKRGGNHEVVQYLAEHGADVNAKGKSGQTALMCAAWGGNKEVIKCLAEHGADLEAKDKDGRTSLMYAATESKEMFDVFVELGADLEAKDNEGMGITRYYGQELAREYRAKQREEYEGNAWKDIQKHTVASVYNSSFTGYGGYTLESGDISVGVSYRPSYRSSPQEVNGKRVSNGKEADEDLRPFAHPFEQITTFVHEGNHRLHNVYDGVADGNFTAEQNVKLDYCSEAIAATSECLTAALHYQRMKDAGIKFYEYETDMSKTQLLDEPIEDLLKGYPPELKKYVVKHGFDPNKKKDVEAVTEIGLKYWKSREKGYAEKGDQFDHNAKPRGTGEGVSQEEFDALIDRMCDGVVIGNGVELDLRQFADKFNGMTDEQARMHVARANGEKLPEKTAETTAKEELKEELKEQKGEPVALEPADKAKQMRLEMKVDNSHGDDGKQVEVKPLEADKTNINSALAMGLNGKNCGR